MESLASIKNNIDLSDSYYEEEYQFLTSAFVKLDNRMNELTEAILTTSYKDAFVKRWEKILSNVMRRIRNSILQKLRN